AFSGRLKRKEQLGGAIIIAALLVAGLIVPSRFRETGAGEILKAALIQGNSTPEEILTAAGKKKILKRYLAMTRQAAAAEPQLQLVVWPETVVDLHMEQGGLHRPEMKALAEELNLNILYGARLRDGSHLYNSITLLSPGDGQVQLYHKQRLVPFVEYFPLHEQLNQILDLDQLKLGCYTAGKEITIFEIKNIPLAAVVCFESYFGSLTRQFARDGARHLFVLTNDVWFGETIGLEQHVQVAAIRAAEMGIGVTQVANSGITASFDYRGREIFRSGKSKPDMFILPLELARRKTVYALAGDYFPAIWAAHLAVSTIYVLAIKRRNRRLAKSL
ncbi:MAG TPA: apolipoprotein N-acyltransferase, partial [Bacillota bacterium]|nr:apolipoprotein N-acyltransferase [Bacillota bacterium]